MLDVQGDTPRKFLIDVESTWDALLHREDSDSNYQITIEDVGPKVKLLRGRHLRDTTKTNQHGTDTLSRHCRIWWLQDV